MIAIHRMSAADLPLLLQLRAQAGWNQTLSDLTRFLALSPGGSFVADWNGDSAGTVCTFIFGSTAWIAMVLVDESLRGRGIGRALMEHALSHLDGLGVERIRLDATPMGRPVYEKLGFAPEYNILRYEGVVPHVAAPPATDELVEPAETRLAELCRLDAAVTDADRSALLRELCGERSRFRVIERDGTVESYVSFRPGARAWHIGPCLATDSCGGALLDWAFFSTQREHVYLDIPEANRAPIAAAEAIGLRMQRTLTRMCRGLRPAERTEMIWASSGPEKG